MNNYILIIIIIIIIIIILLSGKLSEKYSNYNEIINYVYDTENDRNIAMNGIDLKYYINFAFHYKLFNLFEMVTKKLDEKNINYFLIGGGLIGYYRHNKGFVPWDDDIDIGVMEEDKDKIHDAMNELIKDNNIIFRIKSINEDKFDELGIEKVIYKNSEENPIFIDIFYFNFFPKLNNYNFNTLYARNIWPNQQILKDEIFPLQKVQFILYDIYGNKFKEIEIKIPNQSKIYLDRCYPNWETIKKPTHVHSKFIKLMHS